ncbi:MAG: GatB/YqeY domain-containing protein [Clostridia bacterium]|nr:GatB/YqeY domain-containing protein [Clostridia bacterium]
MSLKERLFDDLKTAMKEKDTVRKEVIQIVRAGVLQIEKDEKIDNLDDDSVLTVISKEIKKINDVMPDFEKAQRQDLIDEANKKIELLKAYLPEQLSEAEIEEIVSETIKNVGAQSVRDMGKVMGAVTAKTKGKADNKLVSNVVKKMLQNL